MTETTEKPDTRERLLTVFEVAERYGGIHVKTVAKHARAGKIPKPIKAVFGKGDLWRESDINQHIRGLEQEP